MFTPLYAALAGLGSLPFVLPRPSARALYYILSGVTKNYTILLPICNLKYLF
jgi:hypothetical protein